LVVARTWPAVALGTLFASITVEFLDPALFRNFGHVRLDEVVGVAALVGVVLRLAQARSLRPALASIPGLLPLALFLVLSVESTALTTQDRLYGMTLVAQLVAGMLCYVCVSLLIWEIRRLRRITTPLMVAAAVQAVIGIVALAASKALHHPLPGVRQEPGTGLIEPHGTMIEPDFFGIYLAAVAVLGVALIIGLAARRRLFTARAIIFAAISALAAVGAVVSLARTAWIALIVGVALVVVLSWRFGLFRLPGKAADAYKGLSTDMRGGITNSARWRTALVRAGVSVILVVVVVFAAITGELATLLGRFQQLFNFQSGSGLGRVEVLQLVLQDWQRGPLTGLGVGSFTGHLPGVPTSDHVWIYSMGLAILHDTGIVGVALMVWFVVAVGYALLRAVGKTHEPAARAMGIGALGAAACMFFGAQTTSSMYLPLLWVFLGLAGAIPTLVERFRVAGAPPLAADLAGGYPASDGARSVLHLFDNGDPSASDAMRQRLLMTTRGLTETGWACSAIAVEDASLIERLKQADTLIEIVPPWDTRRRFRMTLQLMLHIQRWRPDVVIVYGATMGGAGGLAARLAGVPCVVYQSDGSVAPGRRGQRRERIACSCADALWCSSASVREEYLARKAAPVDHIHLAPLGVSDEALAQSGHDDDGAEGATGLRRELGWKQSEMVIAYVGSLTSASGVATLLRAYAEIARSQPDTRLLIAGDGQARERLLQDARELGIANGVAFVGGMANNQPFYRLSDVVVFPATSEDGEPSALEAMAAGRPVVAAWDTDIAEHIVDGESGRLAPPDDPGALAKALLWALQSHERARQLGMTAREYVRAHFSEQAAATQASDLLEMELRTMTLD
ncbi:MAG TPA: glycosyltransferase, partial [Ktedonobacterales bacterium]|nr:glycosyltransferase [Ktedonobacterales bacterium]